MVMAQNSGNIFKQQIPRPLDFNHTGNFKEESASGVGKAPPFASVRKCLAGESSAQQVEVGQVGRRGDDQDVPDARQHEGGQRVVDHGLVVDRQQLLGGHERERVQAGAGTAGEDDAFHIFRPLQSKIVINRAVSKSLILY